MSTPVMHEDARKALIQITGKYGRFVFWNPKKCDEYLRAAIPGLPEEIHALIGAIYALVPEDLNEHFRRTPWEDLSRRLIHRLQDNYDFSEAKARWTVETWADALGFRAEPVIPKIVTPEPIKAVTPPPPPTLPAALVKPATDQTRPPATGPASVPSVQPTRTNLADDIHSSIPIAWRPTGLKQTAPSVPKPLPPEPVKPATLPPTAAPNKQPQSAPISVPVKIEPAKPAIQDDSASSHGRSACS